MSESKTPRSDAEESKARTLYEQQREVDWPPFDSSPYDFARALELELNEAREEAQRINGSCQLEIQLLRDANKQANAAIGDIANECKSYVSQLTTVQQDLAKIANALRTQQQRYHDLSEEVEGLKKDKETLLETCKRVVTQMGVRSEPYIPHYVRRDIEQQLRQTIDSAMKGTK